eukprot:CAMPEP_0182843612 /NCGR_PEP_ID=MMETSP0006_2-20121128/26288_1 /TAXON_ID=97485 /ORGANISM="Prymnesium parvum, Strain Texoma1" /LENGTH=165 /DNA_ID=CAMNT_0024973431 /DNA_START=582 /DNA_END=1076 /DNA_ORIENTATION=-
MRDLAHEFTVERLESARGGEDERAAWKPMPVLVCGGEELERARRHPRGARGQVEQVVAVARAALEEGADSAVELIDPREPRHRDRDVSEEVVARDGAVDVREDHLLVALEKVQPRHHRPAVAPVLDVVDPQPQAERRELRGGGAVRRVALLPELQRDRAGHRVDV